MDVGSRYAMGLSKTGANAALRHAKNALDSAKETTDDPDRIIVDAWIRLVTRLEIVAGREDEEVSELMPSYAKR